MIAYRELVTALRGLGFDLNRPLLAHVGEAAVAEVHGGLDSLLGGLLAAVPALMAPVFTLRAMLIPESGPADNGLVYGSGRASNAQAAFFRPNLPADRAMGVMAEGLRRLPQAQRSQHPLLSFCGVEAGGLLRGQSLAQPLDPIAQLVQAGGWVLLWEVDHSANVSLHYAESLAGRKNFLRWALTPEGVVECPRFPGCAQGFPAIAGRLRGMARQAQIGSGWAQAFPARDLVETARLLIERDPQALLCSRPDCLCCQAVRADLARRQE
jgi:aminoglycoside 3-N-acetyltransferase